MEEFKKRIEDLHNRCLNKNFITFTNFLTPTEKQIIKNEYSNCKIYFWGGNENSERVRAFFLPEYIEEIDKYDYIETFKATFSFKKLSHRDFLGALLSLGIDRKCIGDIHVFEKEAYFFVTKEISNFVKANLVKVGSVGIKLEKIDFNNAKISQPKFENINFTVPSLRFDSVLSGAIKESREKTSQIIKAGLALLNYLECTNISQEVKLEDVFSVKGYGKFKLSDIGGTSKKGKIFITVDKFI